MLHAKKAAPLNWMLNRLSPVYLTRYNYVIFHCQKTYDITLLNHAQNLWNALTSILRERKLQCVLFFSRSGIINPLLYNFIVISMENQMSNQIS